MTIARACRRILTMACIAAGAAAAQANAYREKGIVVEVAGSTMTVTPPRDWNRLNVKPAKHAEIWTLDGEQLNDVTFYGGVRPGMPLVKERNKKREPLPKFAANTLLVEVPELLEGTYRAYKHIGGFTLTGSKPGRFLGRDGVEFTYAFTDTDGLPRKGEARAVVIDKMLYMATFEGPRLYYFDRTLADFEALADTARLAD